MAPKTRQKYLDLTTCNTNNKQKPEAALDTKLSTLATAVAAAAAATTTAPTSIPGRGQTLPASQGLRRLLAQEVG